MPRAYQTYDFPLGGADPHVSATSTGTADVKTITAPKGANAAYIACETNGCRFTLDGTTPDATNGMPLPAAALPLWVTVGKDIKVVSQAAANSVVHVLWLA